MPLDSVQEQPTIAEDGKMTGMPIMSSILHQREAALPFVDWAVIEPHETQARRNHGQSLKRLAERGGLSACEAVAILEDRRWHKMDEGKAVARLMELCNAA